MKRYRNLLEDVEILLDRTQKPIARLSTSQTGLKTLYTTTGVRLGSYDPETNITKDENRTIIGYGDLLMSLLPEKS